MSAFFVLITGVPGVGKTTIVKRLVDELRTTNRVCGFYTEEIRGTQGNRIGFDVVSLDAKNRGVLARNDKSCNTSKDKVGTYFVDTSSLDHFLQPIYECRGTTDILIVDEIGKMELKSVLFNQFLSDLVGFSERDKSSDGIIIATASTKTIPIVEKMKSLPDTKLFIVTKGNRTEIFEEIKTTITDYVSELERKSQELADKESELK